jgi:ankyrin repeat protein
LFRPTPPLRSPPQKGETALHLAALAGYLDLIDKLLAMGVNIIAKTTMMCP